MSNIKQRFQNQIATTFVEKVNKLKQDKKIIIQPSKSLFIYKVPTITNNDFMDIEDHGDGNIVVCFRNIEESEEDDEDDS